MIKKDTDVTKIQQSFNQLFKGDFEIIYTNISHIPYMAIGLTILTEV